MSANRLYVGNLPYSISEDELKELFGQHGEVREVTLINDRQTGRSKGFGFVEMGSDDQANAALALNGQEISGRPLKVSIARERQAGGNGGGGRRERW